MNCLRPSCEWFTDSVDCQITDWTYQSVIGQNRVTVWIVCQTDCMTGSTCCCVFCASPPSSSRFRRLADPPQLLFCSVLFFLINSVINTWQWWWQYSFNWQQLVRESDHPHCECVVVVWLWHLSDTRGGSQSTFSSTNLYTVSYHPRETWTWASTHHLEAFRRQEAAYSAFRIKPSRWINSLTTRVSDKHLPHTIHVGPTFGPAKRVTLFLPLPVFECHPTILMINLMINLMIVFNECTPPSGRNNCYTSLTSFPSTQSRQPTSCITTQLLDSQVQSYRELSPLQVTQSVNCAVDSLLSHLNGYVAHSSWSSPTVHRRLLSPFISLLTLRII